MIPWVREKFAERRAKWKSRNNPNEPSVSSIQNTSSHLDLVDNERQICSTSKLSNQNNSLPEKNRDSDLEEKIRIRVLTPNARVLTFQTSIHKKLGDLKHEVLVKFSEDATALPLFSSGIKYLLPKYRFIRPESPADQFLNESLTLAQLNIVDNETLLLSVRRTSTLPAQTQPTTIFTHTPTIQEIEEATRNVPIPETPYRQVEFNDLVIQSDIQFDIRKVLISLAQESAYVLGAGPFAKRLIEMLKQKLINKRKYQNDTIQCLVDMGFTKEKVAYALKIHNGVYANALEWLIQHQSETLPMQAEASTINIEIDSDSNQNKIDNRIVISQNIEALLEIVRCYSHREIEPSPDIVNNLKEMGFGEQQILDALKKTQNNQTAACEYLCGNRSASLMELRDGLAIESPILKAMMESPQVQISLSNPKVFIAYLSMLENQNALAMWLGDNDTSSVISHILRKYHEEKHILGINQLNPSNCR